jgi:type I restriction enzyme S subunit
LYVEISSVDDSEGKIVSPKALLGREAPSRARKVIREGDVIFATTRPYLKNIALVPPDLDGQICTTGFCVLRPRRDALNPFFLYYVSRSDLVVDQLSGESMRGASYPAVTDADVFRAQIPLPPLAEQERIVKRIEALMDRVREARRLRQAAREEAERLWQSVLADTFPRPGSALPPGWRWVRLGEVCEVIMGQSPPSSSYNREGVGLPFFQGKADFGEIHPAPRVWCTEPKKVAEAGDILISVRAPVGPTNLANSKCCIGRGLAALRVGPVADRFWLLFYLRSVEKTLATSGSGSTFNAITREELWSLTIPLPPLAEQRRIVANLEGVQEKIRALRAAQAETDEALRRLEQAILDKAFRGEL